MKYIIIIRARDSIEFKTIPEDIVSLETLQSAVGGYIEVVRLKDEKIMILNEDGKLNGSSYNEIASLLYLDAHPRDPDVIFGDVVIAAENGEEIEGLPEDIVDEIIRDLEDSGMEVKEFDQVEN